MKRFVMYRRGDISDTHTTDQRNAPDEIQFEGVVFSDGTTVQRWCTPSKSTAVWPDFQTMMNVHGHPEERYQSELVWLDGAEEINEFNRTNKELFIKQFNSIFDNIKHIIREDIESI